MAPVFSRAISHNPRRFDAKPDDPRPFGFGEVLTDLRLCEEAQTNMVIGFDDVDMSQNTIICTALLMAMDQSLASTQPLGDIFERIKDRRSVFGSSGFFAQPWPDLQCLRAAARFRLHVKVNPPEAGRQGSHD